MEINEIIKMECIDLNHDGLGVCKVDGFPVFVKDMLIDELAKVKIIKMDRSFARGEIVQMLKSSPNRIKPICKEYGKCGGCQIMHLDYPSQLKFKKKMVEETFKRIGHIEVVAEDIYGMENPYYYRNKVQIPFGMQNRKVICGFYKQKTHDIIPLEECFIEPKLATEMARFVKNLCNELRIDAVTDGYKFGCMRHVLIRKTKNDDYMLVLITKQEKINREKELVDKLIKRYPQIKSIIQNINRENNNVILGDKYRVIYGEEVLIETLCELKFEMGHKSFFQTNHSQTEKLYYKALEYLNPNKDDVIIDAYCGVGTISLLITKHAKKVYGIEIVPEAIENAKKNAKLNSIDNAQFICGASEKEIFNFENEKIDAIVCDPPRKGLDKVMVEALLKKEVEKIVYVSCDVATLARDANLLSEKYNVEKLSVVDMFPWTVSTESVCLFKLKK